MAKDSDGTPVPINDWILVTPHVTAGETEGGILLPDSAKKRINKGNVEAVGPGRPVDGLAMELFFQKALAGRSPHLPQPEPITEADRFNKWPRRPMAMDVGDVVHYPDFAGHEISSDAGNYIMVKEEDVLAIE